MPRPIVERVNTIIHAGLRDAGLVQRLAANGNAPFPSTTEEFGRSMRVQRERWRGLVRVSGVTPEG
jgi:tripartite-type tricarboxylate transporter receptor subunit TctC